MKELSEEAKKIKIDPNKRPDDIDVTKVAPKKLEEANKHVTKIKLPSR